MPTARKAELIDGLAQQLRDSKGAVIVDYRGLSVADITALRRQLAPDEIEFRVAKNTLLKLAADRAEVEIAPELLFGPTAVAFGNRDEVSVAKALTEYGRRSRVVEVKGGVIGGRSMTAAEIGRVAELPTREVLLAQLLGTIQAPLSQTLSVVQAPARGVAGVAEALRNKREAA